MSNNTDSRLDNDPRMKIVKEKLLDLFGNIGQEKGYNNLARLDVENLKKDIEYLTGKRVRTFEEIQQEYVTNLSSDMNDAKEKFKRERLDMLLKNCEINPFWRFSNMKSNGNPAYQEVIDKCKEWVDFYDKHNKGLDLSSFNIQRQYTPGSLLWIYGTFGIGKSMLAGSIAYRFIESYFQPVIFIQWRTLWKKMLSFGNMASELSKYEDTLIDTELLIIDEIAVDNKKLSDAQQQTLGQLLRARKNMGKSTVIVSNANPELLYGLVGIFCYESIKNYSPIYIYNLPEVYWRQHELDGFNDKVEEAKRKAINGVKK